jgi:uncharacterized protein
LAATGQLQPFAIAAEISVSSRPGQHDEVAVDVDARCRQPSVEAVEQLAFLFSRNRLNAAISRAMCLAFVVASPRLLKSHARTIDQMADQRAVPVC